MLLSVSVMKAWTLLGLTIAAPAMADGHRQLGNSKNLFDPSTGDVDGPASQRGQGNGNNNLPFDMLPKSAIASVDRAKADLEDAESEALGNPPRFAIPNPIAVSHKNGDGTWETLEDGTQMWRYRVRSPGCNSLNFGFGEYKMPEGGKLFIYDSKGRTSMSRPFTDKDNSESGELWTPVIESCDVIIEVNLDAKSSPEDLELSLSSANVGYKGFDTRPESEHGKPRPNRNGRELSGSCNVDVVCSEGNDWRDEISSVAAYSTGGSLFCTGAMVNNARQDKKPYFLTAYHCGIRANNAGRMVVYWNYETTSCGGDPNGDLTQTTSGAVFRAGNEASDFTLVELGSSPDPIYKVSYAGWDSRAASSTASSAVAIHHPNVDEKRISFENQATTTTTYGSNTVRTTGTHVRVTDWDIGTTEPGSSGSPLFDADHRIIGQLHGGSAACSNNAPDWYGRIFTSWTGNGSSSTRLSDWLDPDGNTDHVDTLSGNEPPPPPAPTTPPPTKAPVITSAPTKSPTGSPTKTPTICGTIGRRNLCNDLSHCKWKGRRCRPKKKK